MIGRAGGGAKCALACLILLLGGLGAEAHSAGATSAILLFIDESIDQRESGVGLARHLLGEQLIGQGWRVIDERQTHEIKKRKEIALFLQGDSEAALRVDLTDQADFVIRGEALIRSGKRLFGSELRPRMASLAYRLYATKSARVVYSAASTGTYPHIDALQGGREAMALALRSTMPGLLRALAASNGGGVVPASDCELILQDVPDYAQLRRIRQGLRARGLDLSAPRYARGSARFTVLNIRPEALAEHLDSVSGTAASLMVLELGDGLVRAQVMDAAAGRGGEAL